jgi:sulfur-oxidizing protein SoxY
MMRRFLALALLVLPGSAAQAQGLPPDPAQSVMFADMVRRHFSDGPMIFDPRVKVMVPAAAENQMQVPVTIDARDLPEASEIVLVADLNPIQHVLTFRPEGAARFLAVRIKVEQTTPVRAGVKMPDGSWRMGVAVVDAAGGGCTAPAGQRGDSGWTKRLGETQAGLVMREGEAARLTLSMRHPMDTGLAAGIPPFFLERLTLTAPDGKAFGSLDLHEPVAENPTFTFALPLSPAAGVIAVRARDTEGNDYRLAVPVKTKAAAAEPGEVRR